MASGFADTTVFRTADHRAAFIRVVDHQNGVDIHQFTSVQNEVEILLGRNTTFEVMSRDWNPARNRWDFAVREVAP